MADGQKGVCPRDGSIEEEPFDYDVLGNDLFECGECGIIYAQDQEGEATVVPSAGQ